MTQTGAETAVDVRRPSAWRLALPVAVAIAWWLAVAAGAINAERLAALGVTFRDHPAAPALVLAAYAVGAPVLFPITVLLAATALLFPAAQALALGLAGASLAGAEGYVIGRILRDRDPRWLRGPRATAIQRRLQRHGMGVLAVASGRLLPGNFSLLNIAAAALGVRFPAFMVGNALGLLPALSLLTVLGEWWRRM